MSSMVEIIAIVEGKTEQVFLDSVLTPYLAQKSIFLRATQATKPGQKGGDIKFSRVKKDIRNHLRQRSDIYVTTFVDYYGTKEWPGIENVPTGSPPAAIAEHINQATKTKVNSCFPDEQAERRFIPFMAMHEFEALLFSDSALLAEAMDIDEVEISTVLASCGEPEAVNDSPQTAPSKRLDGWSSNGKFAKTTKGIAIATEIGIDRMRQKCPVFNHWITHLESLVEGGS